MESNKKILEVGNTILCTNQYRDLPQMLKVVRVTKTQAILNNGVKLKREYLGAHMKEIGNAMWNHDYYQLAEEKDIQEYNTRYRELKLRKWFEDFYNNASVSQIEKIYNLILQYENDSKDI